ncbi:MAG: SGNH/GDSL hydrolase family protein [Maridesulfovibrio ferrireducens]|nr:SGNH/GDSL hydrolase family protein [Maridesulfovibrio ferrireducens]
MLYFLGNCQMDFLSRAVSKLGYDCVYKVLASPFTYNSSPGIIPQELLDKDVNLGLADFYHDRSLSNQFEMISSAEPEPEAIVINLFHESSPLFINRTQKYIFFIDPKAWTYHPDLEEWMKAGFGMIQVNPSTYMKRYEEMLKNIREKFPLVPILVVSRLSHFPAFGPEPYSYLEGWNDLWKYSGAIFNRWENNISDLNVVDMDRVFSGIWASSEKKIEAHCPFLKFKLAEENNVVTGIHASRDIEHVGSMWPVLAAKITDFIENGKICYSANEVKPDEWNHPWQPEKYSEEELLKMLASGANYLCASAIGKFFVNLEKDYTTLLVRTAEYTPVCHNTLHMIKTYGRIWRNPDLSQWCQAHRKNVIAFTANGPLYTEDYLQRLDEVEKYALGEI